MFFLLFVSEFLLLELRRCRFAHSVAFLVAQLRLLLLSLLLERFACRDVNAGAASHYKKGNIATGDQFIATKEQKDYISNTFDAIAAEMEGGSIGHVCYVNKVPFAILRSISDGDGGETDYQTFAEKAAHQSIEVVLEFIGRAEELK